MMAVQTHAGSTSQGCSNHFPDLQHTPWSPLSTPCLCVVWPKPPHPRTSPVSRYRVDCYCIGRSGRFPLTLRLVYACPNIFLLSIKVSLFLAHNAGGKTIPVVSTFGGCAQYTPYMGYVADPACDSSPSMIRLINLVIGVNVSHRVTDYLFTSNSRNQSLLSHGPAHWSLTV